MRFISYRIRKNATDGQTSGQTEGRTDGRVKNIYASNPLGGGIITPRNHHNLAYQATSSGGSFGLFFLLTTWPSPRPYTVVTPGQEGGVVVTSHIIQLTCNNSNLALVWRSQQNRVGYC